MSLFPRLDKCLEDMSALHAVDADPKKVGLCAAGGGGVCVGSGGIVIKWVGWLESGEERESGGCAGDVDVRRV